MKSTTITHPLRTIVLEHNGVKDLSPLETKAIEVYEGLHGTLEVLIKRLSKLNGRLFKLELDVKKCVEERNKLELEVRKTGPVAGYSYEECLSFNIPDDTEVELNAIVEQALEFQEIVNVLYEDTQNFSQDFQVWETDLDTFDDSLNSFKENFESPIIRNWEEMELDTAAFDSDIQLFLEIYDDLVFEKRKRFIENRNNYVVEYNEEIENIRVIYNRIEKINEFMESSDSEENT